MKRHTPEDWPRPPWSECAAGGKDLGYQSGLLVEDVDAAHKPLGDFVDLHDDQQPHGRSPGGWGDGELTRFQLEFTTTGTEFQRRVWSELEQIPFGTTTTYGALAATLKLPRDRIQALGAAIAANPLLLLRPCHRVIGADGSMRGYAGGVERKVALLTHEGALQLALM